MFSFIGSLLLSLISAYALFILVGVTVASLTPGKSWSFKLFGREILSVAGVAHALPAAGESSATDEDEEEEDDERTLTERLDDAEIPLVEATASPEVGDIGSVFYDTAAYEEDCPSCEQDTLHPFGEIIGAATSDPDATPTRALRNRYGSACDSCGHLDINGTFEPRGRFGPLIGDRVEVDLFLILRGFEAAETAPAEDGRLAEREQELERELSEVRLKRHGLALARGAIAPFRGQLAAKLDDPPDDRAKALPALTDAE